MRTITHTLAHCFAHTKVLFIYFFRKICFQSKQNERRSVEVSFFLNKSRIYNVLSVLKNVPRLRLEVVVLRSLAYSWAFWAISWPSRLESAQSTRKHFIFGNQSAQSISCLGNWSAQSTCSRFHVWGILIICNSRDVGNCINPSSSEQGQAPGHRSCRGGALLDVQAPDCPTVLEDPQCRASAVVLSC